MSCLFTSIEHFIKDEMNIKDLRQEICSYMHIHKKEKIGDSTIEEWVDFSNESEKIGKTFDGYLLRMSSNAQMGGGIELMVASKMLNIKINVEKDRKIISTFNYSNNPTKEITLLYSGNHYDPKTDKIIH